MAMEPTACLTLKVTSFDFDLFMVTSIAHLLVLSYTAISNPRAESEPYPSHAIKISAESFFGYNRVNDKRA